MAAGDRRDPDLGHPQLRVGESGFLQERGGATGDRLARKGLYLDPLQPTSPLGGPTWESVSILLRSPDYIPRLKQHEPMVRDTPEPGDRGRESLETYRLENRRKRLRNLERLLPLGPPPA